jgi:DNA-binding Lrp family transcriptional regulator
VEGVTATSTSAVLRTYKTRDEWSRELLPALPPAVPAPSPRPDGDSRAPRLDHLDMALISALAQDGRRSFVDLGNELDLSETAVARRLGALVEAGNLSFATLVDPAALGFELEAMLHLRVDLSTAESVASFLAGRPEVRYVSATAGYSDITCEAVFRDNDALHDFLVKTLGNLKGVRDLEVDLEIQTLKRAFRHLTLTDGTPEPATEPRAIQPHA